MTTITIEKQIKASPQAVYYALTHASAMHEWLCDHATVAPRPNGRMYLWWHGDFYSSGVYIALEPDKSVTFQWFGRSDPEPTLVTVTLAEKGTATLVTLRHELPEAEAWQGKAADFEREWLGSLDNLVSVLETGKDQRTWSRPMIGISGFSDFNAEIARSLGVPVVEGARLDNLVDGMGAQKAGLQKNDVLVELGGKPITTDFGSFTLALAGRKAGETVEVVFYRGPQKMSLQMALSGRPEPDIPWEPAALGQASREKYDQALAVLEKALAGVTEEEAAIRPAPGEWNVKEVLAHLIHTERFWAFNIGDLVGGYERRADDWGGNIDAHLRATVAAYPTLPALVAELKANIVEVVGFASSLPAEFIARKAAYLGVALNLLNIQSHLLSHVEQIREALAVARK
ncbi:MAG: PDZ domain-containing protein [Chloroflexi bacterium]|nr:PDZ domain-containing protein [Chloroflexota bacterium]